MSQAVFTLLYHPKYLPGAIVLALGLKRLVGDSTNPENPTLGILIDKKHFSSGQLDLLLKYYDELIEVDSLSSPLIGKLSEDLNRPELDKTFTKILLWTLKYDKVLYLDADTLPVVNGAGSILDLLKVDFPSHKILAAPDSGFPDIFNSGVFVLKPNEDTYAQLRRLVDETASNPNLSFDGADQGLLNQYFNDSPDWVSALVRSRAEANSNENTNEENTSPFGIKSNWIKIPFLYNVTPSAQYEYLPAYKHFTQGDGLPKGPIESLNVGGENDEGNDTALASTRDTLNRYHTSALKFINLSSQIKLFHFIGPYKPWTLGEKHSIHKDWWDVWEEEFGSMSVREVTENPKVDVAKLPEPETTQLEIAQPETTQPEEIESEVTEPEENKVFSPQSLLDPANYQHFEDNIEHSADALWDPASAPPPASTGEVHEDSNKIVEGMRAFQNRWDVEDPEEESHEIVQEESHVTVQDEEEKEPAPNFPVHDFVRAERVFDDVPDYFPQHKLQVTEEARQEQQTSNEELDFMEDLTIGEQVSNSTKAELNKENAEFAALEAEAESENVDEPELPGDQYVPKLFPWEYRSRARIERVFE